MPCLAECHASQGEIAFGVHEIALGFVEPDEGVDPGLVSLLDLVAICAYVVDVAPLDSEALLSSNEGHESCADVGSDRDLRLGKNVQGGLPATFVFDRQGTLRREWRQEAIRPILESFKKDE